MNEIEATIFTKQEEGMLLSKCIEHWSKELELNNHLVSAIIEVESGFNTYATRFEEGFFHRYIEHKTKDFLGGHWPRNRSTHTERYFRAASWGAMQIMGQTARELGFDGDDFSELCRPYIGVQYGCKYLKKMFDLYESIDIEKELVIKNAVAAYNGGPGSPNFEYAEKVLDLCDE